MKRLLVILLVLLCPSLALAGQSKTASVTAENSFTAGVLIKEHGTVRISGTFVATVTLQRSEDEGSTWVDTGVTWTSGGVYIITDYTRQQYRVGIKTGGFTSGTVSLWIGSGD